MIRRRRALVALAAVLWLLVATTVSAQAHTAIRRSTPGPGDRIEGTVREVRLEFLDPVQAGTELTVSDVDGDPVPGLSEPDQPAPDVVVVSFEPLGDPGTFRVDYRYASLDGDVQVGSHQFAIVADDGRGPGFSVGLGVLVGLGALGAVVARRTARRARAT